jgi:hypothetical protein
MVASALAAGSQDILEVIGRVPHVRPSVRGSKKMGAARQSLSDESPANPSNTKSPLSTPMLCVSSHSPVAWVGRFGQSDRRASPIFFGPRTLGRTWGTRPITFKIRLVVSCQLLAGVDNSSYSPG